MPHQEKNNADPTGWLVPKLVVSNLAITGDGFTHGSDRTAALPVQPASLCSDRHSIES